MKPKKIGRITGTDQGKVELPIIFLPGFYICVISIFYNRFGAAEFVIGTSNIGFPIIITIL